MATEIPEARGFAAALERHLANGGGMRKSGLSRKAGFTYTKGKARGLTVEEATQQAREMWEGASPQVRDKYARRATSGLLAPSERMAASIQRPDPVRNVIPMTSQANQLPKRQPASAAPMATPPKASSQQASPTLAAPSRSQAIAQRAVASPPPMSAPSRSQAIAAGAIERPPASGGKRINPLTGKPFGWDPRDEKPADSSATPAYAGPKTGAGRMDPDLGFVPSAVPVAEAPMTQAEYDKLGSDIKTTIAPNSPEMSSALGRRRMFEDQQMRAKASTMRRERMGPSHAERAEADRKARRALDQRISDTYGAIS